MDTSLQKAGIPGFHRCVEHTSVFSKLCKEANKERGFNCCSSVVRPRQHLLICPSQADWASNETVPFTRKCAEDYRGNTDSVHCWRVRHILAESREGGIHWICHLPYPVCNGNGDSANDKFGDPSTTNQRLHRWSHSDNNNSNIQARWVLSTLEDSVSLARMNKVQAKDVLY